MIQKDPIFVVGVGRSGTSLLQCMLAAHSQLAFPPETGFFRRYVVADRLTKEARQSGIRAVEQMLSEDSRVSRLEIDILDVLAGIASAGPLTGVAVYRSLLQQNALKTGKPLVGDKDPRLVEYLDSLHGAFPDATVVHVIRDPRDVVASKKKALWSQRHSILRHVLAGRVQFSIGRRDGRRLFAETYVEVFYESLIKEPQVTLRNLCARIGIDFEQAMLEFSGAAEQLVSPEERQWKGATLGPILPENRGKWRDALSDWEAVLVERACGAAIKAGNYEKSDAESRLDMMSAIGMYISLTAVKLLSVIYKLFRRSTKSSSGSKT